MRWKFQSIIIKFSSSRIKSVSSAPLIRFLVFVSTHFLHTNLCVQFSLATELRFVLKNKWTIMIKKKGKNWTRRKEFEDTVYHKNIILKFKIEINLDFKKIFLIYSIFLLCFVNALT